MWVGGDLKILRLPFAVAPLSYIFTACDIERGAFERNGNSMRNVEPRYNIEPSNTIIGLWTFVAH